jgi:UDP-N-acetylglucosamine:LPS N-acetylglucosamine transferase
MNIIQMPGRYESMQKAAVSFAKTDAADKIAKVLIEICLSHV